MSLIKKNANCFSFNSFYNFYHAFQCGIQHFDYNVFELRKYQE